VIQAAAQAMQGQDAGQIGIDGCPARLGRFQPVQGIVHADAAAPAGNQADQAFGQHRGQVTAIVLVPQDPAGAGQGAGIGVAARTQQAGGP